MKQVFYREIYGGGYGCMQVSMKKGIYVLNAIMEN